MRVSILSRYSRLGASSRLRTMQYIPALKAAGLEVTVNSFFDDAYLRQLYGGQRERKWLLRYYLERLEQCRASNSADVIWLEKEALPWLPWSLERLALPHGIPLVSDYDDAVFHRYDLHRQPMVRMVLGNKIDHVMAYSSLVTAGNDYLADRARTAGAPWVEVVPTVVDTEAYQPSPCSRMVDKLRVGWIGTPQTWKKYGLPRSDLFQNVAHHHDARFYLVGAHLHSSSDGAFDYVPWSEGSEIAAIQRMDVGIMPLMDDPWERGKCGYKLIQYMACGLPVIASPVGVNREIVEHGVNGFLASSEKEWRSALCGLLNDSELRRKMGNAGREKVVAKYSIQAQGPRVARLLIEAIQRGGRR